MPILDNPKIMLDSDYAYFKNLVMIHSIQRPPYSEKIFKYKTIMLLLDYTTNTYTSINLLKTWSIDRYFRHYLMYKYTFTKKIRMEFVIENFMPQQEPVMDEMSTASDLQKSPIPGESVLDYIRLLIFSRRNFHQKLQIVSQLARLCWNKVLNLLH